MEDDSIDCEEVRRVLRGEYKGDIVLDRRLVSD